MIKPNSFYRQSSVNLFTAAMIFISIFIMVSEAMPQTQESCATELKEATQKFLTPKLDEAIVLLRRCLNKVGITNDDKVEAYKLLGKVYIAKRDTNEAKNAFRMALELNPELTLTPTDDTTEEVVKIFYGVKQKPPSVGPWLVKKPRSKKWLWIGGGTAVVAISAIVLRKGNTDEGFVKPPGRPPQ